MKKKFVLAAAVAAIMMLGLAGCGVKLTPPTVETVGFPGLHFVISTPTDNGCPPEEHAGGLC